MSLTSISSPNSNIMANEEPSSRRLVEYFIVVSCKPRICQKIVTVQQKTVPLSQCKTPDLTTKNNITSTVNDSQGDDFLGSQLCGLKGFDTTPDDSSQVKTVTIDDNHIVMNGHNINISENSTSARNPLSLSPISMKVMRQKSISIDTSSTSSVSSTVHQEPEISPNSDTNDSTLLRRLNTRVAHLPPDSVEKENLNNSNAVTEILQSESDLLDQRLCCLPDSDNERTIFDKKVSGIFCSKALSKTPPATPSPKVCHSSHSSPSRNLFSRTSSRYFSSRRVPVVSSTDVSPTQDNDHTQKFHQNDGALLEMKTVANNAHSDDIDAIEGLNKEVTGRSPTKLNVTLPADSPSVYRKRRPTNIEMSERSIRLPGLFGNALNFQDSHEVTFQPVITSRYPFTDYPDSPLNAMVTQFCFPNSHTVELTTEYRIPRIHYFVLTNDKGQKMYGTCLTVYEEFIPRLDDPNISAEDKTILQALRESFGTVSNLVTSEGVELSLKSPQKKKILYLPKVICLLSTWPYLRAFREYISQLYRLATTTNTMKIPIERYILNICQEIPAPPPGSFEIQVKILSSTIRFWAPPAKLPIAYVALPFRALFECLDVDNVIFAWYALTLERKLLLVSSQYSLLTVCAEILLSLLFPLRWNHLYIPILPRFLSPMLDAPMPYLCGISRDNFLYAVASINDETIVVDLDRNVITVGSNMPDLPPMPLNRRSKLEKILDTIATPVFWLARGLKSAEVDYLKAHGDDNANLSLMENAEHVWQEKLEGYDNAFNLVLTPESTLNSRGDEYVNELKTGESKIDLDSVQEAFLRFFVSMLKDYRKFLSEPHDADINDRWKSVRSFHTAKFVSSQRRDFQPFLREFCQTQLFDDFITRRTSISSHVDDADIVFFDQSITAKANRSKMTFKKKKTPFLTAAYAHKKLNVIEAIAPNEDDFVSHSFNFFDQFYIGYDKNASRFSYSTWPECFVESHFCAARPIPQIIAAEFDRQAALTFKLSSNQAQLSNSDFQPGPVSPSLEVATFTLFLVVFSSLIGHRVVELAKQNQPATASIAKLVESELTHNVSGCVKNETMPGFESYVDSANRDNSSICGSCDFLCCSDWSSSDILAIIKSLGDRGTENSESNRFFVPPRELPEVMNAVEIEEALIVAKGQLDLAFYVLDMAEVRKIETDIDTYKVLMDSVSRCGDCQRATQLINLVQSSGQRIDRELYSSYLSTFSHAHDMINTGVVSKDVFAQSQIKAKDQILPHHSWTTALSSDASLTDSLSENSSVSTSFWDGHYRLTESLSSPFKRKEKLKRKEKIVLTAEVSKHIEMGRCLLDYLYDNLEIDASDTCPRCSCVLKEDEVMIGWRTCDFFDYTTCCPQCNHRFVARFVVKSTSPIFMGSQGKNTPLYCEFLSPWVLRKEVENVIRTSNGVCAIIDPEWRQAANINSTLWWNMIISFQRHLLPITFLLQGNFKEHLVMPFA